MRLMNQGSGETPRTVLPGLVLAIFVFNMADAICTMSWIEAGIAEEANLFMNWLINLGYSVFVVVKMVIVVAGLAILWKFKYHKLARVGLVSLTAIYAVLVLYHLYLGLRLAALTTGMDLAGLT